MNTLLETQSEDHHNILVVDDDQDTCRLLESLFQINGYYPTIACSGQEAVQYVQVSAPDAIILDVMMPDMDGWETFARIRSYSDVPVLLLTALTSEDCVLHAHRLGINHYMSKPFSTQELLAWIDVIIKSAKSKQAIHETVASQKVSLEEMGITVVIPAYNEARFIGSTVLKAREYAQTIIVVDDGSNDQTAEIAEEAGAVVVQHEINKGKGTALNTGFCKAKELGAQVVVTLDADGQHLPEELYQLVRPVIDGEADIVIGSRYLERHSEVPRHRIWGHWFFNQLTHLASGAPSTDSQSGYRAFSAKALEHICFSSKRFSVESEMQFIAHENNLRLKEVPITILYMDKPKRSVISQGMTVLGGIFKLMGQYRPLFYFGLPGIAITLLGLVWGWGVITRYQEVHQLAIGNALISILLTMIGIVIFSTGFMLHSIRGLLVDLLRPKKQ
jgi:DNA-binding response OmpR family regulator